MDDDNTLSIKSINPTRDDSEGKPTEPEVRSDEFEIPQLVSQPSEVVSPNEPELDQAPDVVDPIPESTPAASDQGTTPAPPEPEPALQVEHEETEQDRVEATDVSTARDKISQLDDPLTTKSAHPATQQPLVSLTPAGGTGTTTSLGVARTPYQINLPTKWMKPILGALGIFLLVLTLFETPVIYHQIQFLLNKSNSFTTANTATTAIGSESVIDIPKINIHAPIVYEASTAEANIQHALEGGVVHYASTAVPGQAGNDVIVGHSSNDWWEPGNYKFVFVLLDKLIPGDTFSINYQSERYVYKVTGTKVVAPTDVGVLSPTANPTVTLITCTPPGTSWKRLVVTADQIGGPHSSEIAAQTNSPTSEPLPSDSGGAGSILSKIWHDITSLFKHQASPDQTPQNSTNALPQNL